MKPGILRFCFLLYTLALVVGCAGGDVRPLTDSGVEVGKDTDEARLLDEAAKSHKALKKRGLILDNPGLSRYLQGVLRRLMPSGLAGDLDIRVAVVRDPVVNAYAFPDGGIYLNIGLLERLENEVQLAHVLAHELAHVIQRHSLSGYKSRKAKVIAAHVTDLMLLGTSVAYIPFIASISSYSRAHEREADEMALQMLADAGYPLSGSVRLFEVIQEVKVQESVSTSIYSSHPGNMIRARYTQDLIESGKLEPNEGATDNAEVYQAICSSLHSENIRLRLLHRHYELARDSAERALKKDPDNPWYHYYRGEAYRKMAEDPKGTAREHARLYDKSFGEALTEEMKAAGDGFSSNADLAYRQALLLDADFAYAYRGLGLLARARGDTVASRNFLDAYLANAVGIPDRRYVEKILEEMESE